MNYKVDISIIVPIYNVEKYLNNCLTSIITQEFNGSFEVILINDNSQDNCKKVCESFLNSSKNFIFIDLEFNKGVSNARNVGLDKSRGKYFMFVDPDDTLPKNAISILHSNINLHNVDIVKGNNKIIYESENKSKLTYPQTGLLKFQKPNITPILLEHKLTKGHPWGKLYRSSQFLNIRFDNDLRMAEDLLFNMEAFSQATTLLIIDDNVYNYSLRADSTVRKKFETKVYLDWLESVSSCYNFINQKVDFKYFQELQVKTLLQLIRDAKGLNSETLKEVLTSSKNYENKWNINFLSVISSLRIKNIFRYLKYRVTIKNISN